jgi:hypothetical protein
MPAIIRTEDFAQYPPLARVLATKLLPLLQELPPVFAALLLTEIIGYDWRFPAEQADIDRQLLFLTGFDPAQRQGTMAAFAALTLSADLQQQRYAAAPAAFVEQLTAYLWTVHQMDAFHTAAKLYQQAFLLAQPEPEPAMPRLCLVVIGKGAAPCTIRLFQKLRPHGTYFTHVAPAHGLDTLLAEVAARVTTHREPYAHWVVDGGALTSPGVAQSGLVTISYQKLEPLRNALLKKVDTVRTSGDVVGPESLRSLLVNLQPGQLESEGTAHDPILRHFELSLLTEGSGTQIFSTTFVQWAGREVLRRARPLTLLLRYAPRQKDRPMNEMLRVESGPLDTDPAGSLVDADMGAYYTWINLMRLTGAAQSRFIVWFEDQQEALAISPGTTRGVASSSPCDLRQILDWTA